MPLFKINKQALTLISQTNFNLEKDLQNLIEKNLEVIFNCKFVASEFSTGAEHAGRIDTLALSEENNPVIIEYKKNESSELINQSLFYLSWIQDHRGDYQLAVNNRLGTDAKVDWTDIRVICIAPGYRKYDLHAVKMMGANIELWQYRFYDDGSLYIEEVFRKSRSLETGSDGRKNPVMVEAGRKAAITRANSTYTFEEHIADVDAAVVEVVEEIREFTMGLDDSVEETPKKFYVAYKVAQNFVCMQVQKKQVTLFLKLNPSEYKPLPANARDVSEIGHYGTGNFELLLKSKNDIEEAKTWIRKAFERIGG